MAIRKFFQNLSQGPPNPGFMQERVQKGDFLKKDSRESKFFSYFRFLWISRRPWTLNWERVVFLPSKNLYRKCDWVTAWLFSFQVLEMGCIQPWLYVDFWLNILCFMIVLGLFYFHGLNWSKDFECSNKIDSNWLPGYFILDSKWKKFNFQI